MDALLELVMIIGPMALLAFVGWLFFERQSDLYREMISRVEAERDQAQQQATIYRNLLFPAMAKAELIGAGSSPAPLAPTAQPPQGSRASGSSKVEPSRRTHAAQSLGRRFGFRFRFNQARREKNSAQQLVDALAEKLPHQEKNHA